MISIICEGQLMKIDKKVKWFQSLDCVNSSNYLLVLSRLFHSSSFLDYDPCAWDGLYLFIFLLIHLKWLRCLPLLLTFLPSLNVVFGLYFHILCRTLSHAWSNSTPLVSISSCTYLISNLLSKHGVEHDSLLQFPWSLIPCSCSRKHV